MFLSYSSKKKKNKKKFILTYDDVEQFYARYFHCDFKKPIMLETSDHLSIFHLEFPTVIHQVYDLFSHLFDITTSYPCPKFTFAGDIIHVFKSFHSISDLESLPSLSTSTRLLKNPANSEITDATIASFTNNPDTIPSFTDYNSEAYIRCFLYVIGDPTTFAQHLRHSVLVLNLLRSWSDFNSFAKDVTTLLNTIALTCLFHFHIICEYYNIVQCGSLDFALSVKRMTLPLNRNSPVVPSLSQHYNDDEIHFLTTILPNAFKSSPMYPGELNQGIIFPLSLGPYQSAAFTQHYTKLLPSASTSRSKNIHKVPTTNIPFPIFAYLALLNTIMSCALSKAIKNRILLPIFLILSHVPNLPTDLCRFLISRNYIATPIVSNVSNFEKLQVLYFTLHQHIQFPILPNDPLASLKSINSIEIICTMIIAIKRNLISTKTNPTMISRQTLAISSFGLILAHIVIMMFWFEFNIFFLSHKMNDDDKSGTVSSFQLKYQQSNGFHQESQTSTFSIFLPTLLASTNPIISPSLKNNTKQTPLIHSFNFCSILNLITNILQLSLINKSIPIAIIDPYLHPSLLLMIFSLAMCHNVNSHPAFFQDLDKFMNALHIWRLCDLDSQLDSTISLILYLYFEYHHLNYVNFGCVGVNKPAYRLQLLQTLNFNRKLRTNVILTTNILPGINHTLASLYYSGYPQQDFNFTNQRHLSTLQSELTNVHKLNVNQSFSRHCTKIVQQMIFCNKGHALYRKLPHNCPATHPSAILHLNSIFSHDSGESITLPIRSLEEEERRRKNISCEFHCRFLSEMLWCSFFDFFLGASISLLSNNLHYINFTQDLLNSIHPIQQNNNGHDPLSLHSPIQLTDKAISLTNDQDHAPQPNKITMHCFSHPSTLLGMDSQLYCIPFMAIQHNFSRTLFHLISCQDWTSMALKDHFLNSNLFMPTLLYLNFLHTFLCKPIAIIPIKSELDHNSMNSADESIPIDLFQKLTTLTNSLNHTDSDSTLNALWNCVIPTSPSTSITSLSLSDQHQFNNILINIDTSSNPTLLTYSSVKTTKHTSSSPFTFHKFCQTPHYKSNLYKHTHLPPSVVKQLYYIYTEALIFTIQGFSFALFTTQLKDQKFHHPSRLLPRFLQRDEDFGISSLLSSPNNPFNSHSFFNTHLTWNQLTDFGGTIERATQIFRSDTSDSAVSATMVQNDSYHQHIMNLCYNPQQVQYSFKPERYKTVVLQRGAKTTVPDYILDQQRSGMVAIAYEWSSAMVQHSIELFLELLLNQGSYEFISQIDFSDDKQPLAEEYVIDYIPHNPADWGNKDKWASNLPENCTDEDTFPLYKLFTPTKYQAQIPTFATSSIYPQHSDYLPHSVYNPTYRTQEQKDALVSYYKENKSLVPALVFTDESKVQGNDLKHDLKHLGFKTPTRGHLPYFYNLSTKEQDELYQAFSFINLTSVPPTISPLAPSTITPITTVNSPPLLNINFAEYLNHVNNEIPLLFQQMMVPGLNNDLLLQRKLWSQSQYLIKHYSTSLCELNGTSSTNDSVNNNPTPDPTQTQPQIVKSNTLQFHSLVPPQDIIDVFTLPYINDEYTTPNTRHLYSSLPPSVISPQILPATFTIPALLLFDHIQASKLK